MDKIINEFSEVFRDVMDNDTITVTEATSAKDIEEWDSLTHIQLVVAVEKRFQIKFTSNEILNWKNVGDILASIKNKQA
jgi:acyl carrier protein